MLLSRDADANFGTSAPLRQPRGFPAGNPKRFWGNRKYSTDRITVRSVTNRPPSGSVAVLVGDIGEPVSGPRLWLGNIDHADFLSRCPSEP